MSIRVEGRFTYILLQLVMVRCRVLDYVTASLRVCWAVIVMVVCEGATILCQEMY